MSDINNKVIEESVEDYEQDKASYEVLDYYDMPAWYKRWFIWLWPLILVYLFLIAVSSPGSRMFTVVAFGGIIVLFQLIAVFVRKHWPL